jgi:GNAT superfamily N-acetyltransferase
MPIAFRTRDEWVAELAEFPGLEVRQERSAAVMAALQRRTEEEIQKRFDAGNRAYVAFMDDVPAAWGWVATGQATIGEVKASFTMKPAERYLWNFVTLPEFRGLGIYPRLIQAIVEKESVDGERFWIAYAPENHASGAGIVKAGFTVIADLSFDRQGLPVVKDIRAGGGSAASQLLGLREIQDAVAQCWKCARGESPMQSSCASGTCSCDYQKAEKACAA